MNSIYMFIEPDQNMFCIEITASQLVVGSLAADRNCIQAGKVYAIRPRLRVKILNILMSDVYTFMIVYQIL